MESRSSPRRRHSTRSAGRARAAEYRLLDSVKVRGEEAVEIVEILHREVPREALALFRRAAPCMRGGLEAAIACFNDSDIEKCRNSWEPDGPCRTYLSRCEKFKVHSPRPRLDGSWGFDSK